MIRSRFGLKRRGLLNRIPKTIIFLVVLTILSIYLFVIIEKNLKPTIIQISESRAHLIATEAIHKVLYEKVLNDVNYNDLVYVHKDTQLRITMMQANTIKINRIVSQANLEIKNTLLNLSDESFQIPLGQTLGSQILANYGPRINVKIVPVGTVDVKFLDEFQQAGINQVRHILYLNVATTVKIVVPLATKGITVSNQIPIAETIIVGQVPETYLGVQLDSLKDLVQGKNSEKTEESEAQN